MKIYRIIYTLFLVFSCVSVLAEGNSRSENNSVYKDHYGIVDDIYSDESRIVISDVSLIYNHASAFYNARGRRVSGIKEILRSGTAVKYHFYQESPSLILKDVRVISMYEFNKAREANSDVY
jgi:hypothetical protein